MSDYHNEDDWQIELRRLKADNKFRVCRVNFGFRLTTRSVLCCFLCHISATCVVFLDLSIKNSLVT